MGLRLKIANCYGNVDVRKKLSKAYVHVGGQRLQPLCRKLGIKYAQALVGFSERGWKVRFGYQPEFDGVVVSARSAQKLRRAIEGRVKRTAERPQKSQQQLAAERNRRQLREADSFAAAIESQFPNCPVRLRIDALQKGREGEGIPQKPEDGGERTQANVGPVGAFEGHRIGFE